MLQRLRGNSEKGFTLIELMIVIAIIGILAAIAIPNFISYRDKAYCSGAETDVQTIMGAIADYFADPANRAISVARLTDDSGPVIAVSNNNDWTITDLGSNQYRVTVTDTSGRCPRFTTTGKTL